jgi:RNA polymerase sigma-70 factor (ECF subfamily)
MYASITTIIDGPSERPAPASEEELGRLVELAKGGDRQAFGLLYQHLAPKVYSYFYHHLGGQSALAEDLAEDVFLNVLRRLDSYTACGLPFSAWIFRVAHNRLVDHFRAQQRRPQVPLDSAGEATDLLPERELQRVVDRQTLMAALDKLTPSQRNVVVLRFLQHLSLAETALALGRTEDGVKKLQQRALDALRRSLSAARAVA